MRTKKYCYLLLTGCVIVAPPLSAKAATNPKAGKFGLGIALFDPVGPSLKYKVTDKQAIDGAIGWSYRGIHLHVQYLADEITLAKRKDFSLNFYYGAGLRIITHSTKSRLGLRVPAGLNLFLSPTPVEFFAELAPVLNLVPETSLNLDVTLGARYFL